MRSKSDIDVGRSRLLSSREATSRGFSPIRLSLLRGHPRRVPQACTSSGAGFKTGQMVRTKEMNKPATQGWARLGTREPWSRVGQSTVQVFGTVWPSLAICSLKFCGR